MNLTDFDACEVTRYVSATTIRRLETAIEQGSALVSAWRLSDQNVVPWHREIDAGCACGCFPPK
jgi:hypothetical protein